MPGRQHVHKQLINYVSMTQSKERFISGLILVAWVGAHFYCTGEGLHLLKITIAMHLKQSKMLNKALVVSGSTKLQRITA